MACIVKKHHLKVLFKEMQFVAFFSFYMGKTRMQVKNDLRCLRQKILFHFYTSADELMRIIVYASSDVRPFCVRPSHTTILDIFYTAWVQS